MSRRGTKWLAALGVIVIGVSVWLWLQPTMSEDSDPPGGHEDAEEYEVSYTEPDTVWTYTLSDELTNVPTVVVDEIIGGPVGVRHRAVLTGTPNDEVNCEYTLDGEDIKSLSTRGPLEINAVGVDGVGSLSASAIGVGSHLVVSCASTSPDPVVMDSVLEVLTPPPS